MAETPAGTNGELVKRRARVANHVCGDEFVMCDTVKIYGAESVLMKCSYCMEVLYNGFYWRFDETQTRIQTDGTATIYTDILVAYCSGDCEYKETLDAYHSNRGFDSVKSLVSACLLKFIDMQRTEEALDFLKGCAPFLVPVLEEMKGRYERVTNHLMLYYLKRRTKPHINRVRRESQDTSKSPNRGDVV